MTDAIVSAPAECPAAECPPVAKTVGASMMFDRTRRITGYLVGDLRRFNNAKRAEESDRVRHGT